MTKKEIKRLDDIWKVKVKEDAGWRCELDGTPKGQCQLNSHHYYGCRSRSTRWYLPNGVCLSASRHTLGVWSAHESPEWFRGQMLDLRGKKWLDDLMAQHNKTFKGDYQKVKDYLDGKINNYC